MGTHDVRFAASYNGHYWARVNMHVPIMHLSLLHFGSESIRSALYICFIIGASLARRSACSRWKQTSTQPSVHACITMFVFSYFASRQDGGLLRPLLSEFLAALQSPTYTESFKQSLPRWFILFLFSPIKSWMHVSMWRYNPKHTTEYFVANTGRDVTCAGQQRDRIVSGAPRGV